MGVGATGAEVLISNDRAGTIPFPGGGRGPGVEGF